MIVLVDYASPSVLESTARCDRRSACRPTCAGACASTASCGQHGFILRIALRTLGEAIWSNDTWIAQSDLLDPVITVHRDRIFFEAFSQDQSTYVCADRGPGRFRADGRSGMRHHQHRFHGMAVGCAWGSCAPAARPPSASALRAWRCAPPAPGAGSRRRSSCLRPGCAASCRCRPPWACRAPA